MMMKLLLSMCMLCILIVVVMIMGGMDDNNGYSDDGHDAAVAHALVPAPCTGWRSARGVRQNP